MWKIVFIGFGGAIGTLLRYAVSSVDYKLSNGVFPVSTFIVNVTGSLIVGFLFGLFENINVSSNTRMFIFMGLLGGFTTFSTFSLENFSLIRDGELKIALANILTTNIIGIACVFLGFIGSKLLLNAFR